MLLNPTLFPWEDKDTIVVTYLRDEVKYTTEIKSKLFTIADLLDLKLPDMVMAFSLMFLSCIILTSDRYNKLNQGLVICFLFSSISYSVSFSSLFWNEDTVSKFLDVIGLFNISIASLSIVNVGLLLAPLKNKKLSKIIRILFFCLALVSCLQWGIARYMFWAQGRTPHAVQLDTTAYYNSQNILSLSVFFTILLLIKYLVFNKGKTYLRTRRTIVPVLMSFLATMPTLALNFANRIHDKDFILFIQYLDLRYLLLLIPFTTAATILRFQTFRSYPPSLMVVLLMISASISGNLINLLVFELYNPNVSQGLIHIPVLILTFITNSFFWYQSSMQGIFGRVFHKERLNTQDSQRLIQALMERKLEFRELPFKIVSEVEQYLND